MQQRITFGWLRRELRKREIPLYRVAADLEIHPSRLSRVLGGYLRPRANEQKYFADVLGITIAQLCQLWQRSSLKPARKRMQKTSVDSPN